MNWAHAGTAVLAAFLASLVEFVEALTIVLTVGTTRGWRSALTDGSGSGGQTPGRITRGRRARTHTCEGHRAAAGMSAIPTALAEVWGLFVEDAAFTLAVVACLIGTWLIAPVLGFAPAWRAALYTARHRAHRERLEKRAMTLSPRGT